MAISGRTFSARIPRIPRASILKEGLQEGFRKAVCEHNLKAGVKKAVSQGFYEIEREAPYEEYSWKKGSELQRKLPLKRI